MEQPSTNTTTAPTAHKTFQYKLQPTPAQELALEEVLWRCRVLYNTALEQRLTWWRRGQGHSATRFQQEAELKEIRAAFPEYGAIHSHVVQDVLARLDKPSQAFFRRLANAEKPGFPRFQGRNRSPSFTYQEDGNGARRENGYLVLATIGRSAVRWSRPMEGPSKPVPLSREADGWQVSCAWAQGPRGPGAQGPRGPGARCPASSPRPRDGQRRAETEGCRCCSPRRGGRRGGAPAPRAPGPEGAGKRPEAGESPPDGQQTPPQRGEAARQEASPRAAPAAGLPPHDRPVSGAQLRHALL